LLDDGFSIHLPTSHRKAYLETRNPGTLSNPELLARPRIAHSRALRRSGLRIYAGILRNARITPQGTLLIHQTATNRVIEVTPQKR
jgi:hypothetical protein